VPTPITIGSCLAGKRRNLSLGQCSNRISIDTTPRCAKWYQQHLITIGPAGQGGESGLERCRPSHQCDQVDSDVLVAEATSSTADARLRRTPSLHGPTSARVSKRPQFRSLFDHHIPHVLRKNEMYACTGSKCPQPPPPPPRQRRHHIGSPRFTQQNSNRSLDCPLPVVELRRRCRDNGIVKAGVPSSILTNQYIRLAVRSIHPGQLVINKIGRTRDRLSPKASAQTRRGSSKATASHSRPRRWQSHRRSSPAKNRS